MAPAMKIVVAPQAFKGSISAADVGRAMREGVLRVFADAEIEVTPVADGGDGTLQTLVAITGGSVRSLQVTGPLGDRIEAQWGALGDGNTAVIEMARTSGLALVPHEKRNPLLTTTYGLGEAIAQALDDGFRNFIIGIGGSATNDGGAGMAQALGVRMLDEQGRALPHGGAALARLAGIDVSGLDRRARESTFLVACDVSNPLTGPEGAAAIYGPQKGATPEVVWQLDAALHHFAQVVKTDLSIDIEDIPGAGAAGGLGGGFVAFLDGELRPGVNIVLDLVDMASHLDGANLVITGEGCLDYQTIYSKAPIGVAQMAQQRGIPTVCVSGSLGDRYGLVHDHGIDAASAIATGPMSLAESSANAAELITAATEQAMRFIQVGGRVFAP